MPGRGIPVDGVLSCRRLAALVRRGFDELPSPPAAAWPWPVAAEVSWSAVRTDGTWHATYWVAEWPRSDVSSDFLLPLLVGCEERRIGRVVMAAVPPQRAMRAAEHARTSTTADAELRRRHGFATSARRSREHEAVARREGELAEGHAAYRFSGYVTVTGRQRRSSSRRACARVEQAAALAAVELRRLYGAQGEALTFTLPTGKGVRVRIPPHEATTAQLGAAYPLAASRAASERRRPRRTGPARRRVRPRPVRALRARGRSRTRT